MTRRAVTDPTTGRVKRWGDTDFTAQLNGDVQTVIGDDDRPDPALPLHHQKIAAGTFAPMTAPERAASDAQLAALDAAQLPDAARIERAVLNTGALPLPPPRAGLLVAVRNVGGGTPGLAYSTATGWVIFTASSVVT